MSNLEHTADENPAIDRNFQKLARSTLDTANVTAGIRFGTGVLVYTASATSAILTVTHNLGTTPQFICLTPSTSGFNAFALDYVSASRTDTTFDVVGAEINGAAVTLNENFFWMVIG